MRWNPNKCNRKNCGAPDQTGRGYCNKHWEEIVDRAVMYTEGKQKYQATHSTTGWQFTFTSYPNDALKSGIKLAREDHFWRNPEKITVEQL